MKRPTPPRGEVRDLIAQCLQLFESSGPRAVGRAPGAPPGLLGPRPRGTRPAARPGPGRRGARRRRRLERIGEYRIVGVLGRGGMGVVYEAEQERPRRRVALKVLRACPSERARARFEHEAELLARLQHPGDRGDPRGGHGRGRRDDGPLLRDGARARAAARRLRRRSVVARPAQRASRSWRGSPTPCTTRTRRASCTATSSRATCWWTSSGEPRVLDFGVARADRPATSRSRRCARRPASSRHAALHEPRAGRRPTAGRRQPERRVLAGRARLRAARGAAADRGPRALPVLEAVREVQERDPPRLGQIDRALRGRPGDDRRHRPGPGERAPLRLGARAGRRPAALPGGRADHRPAGHGVVPAAQVRAPPPGAGRRRRWRWWWRSSWASPGRCTVWRARPRERDEAERRFRQAQTGCSTSRSACTSSPIRAARASGSGTCWTAPRSWSTDFPRIPSTMQPSG